MTRPAVSLILLGIGWLGLILALLTGNSVESWGIVLGSLLLAECLSDIISAPVLKLRKERADVVGHALLGWLLLCGGIVFAFQPGFLDFFQGQSFAALCMLGLVLVLGLLKLPPSHGPPGIAGQLISFRLLFSAAIVVLLDLIGATGADIIIVSIIAVNLCLLLLNADRLLRQPVSFQKVQKGWMSYTVQYMDVLIMFVVLPKEQAIVYLIARGLSMTIVISLEHLSEGASAPLIRAYRRNDHAAFITMAARLNLGFLLIGGGLALGILNVGPPVGAQLFSKGSDFNAVLGWLVLGVSGPIFFGGTRVLLHATANGPISFLIDAAAVVMVVVSAVSSAAPTAVFIAQCMASAHLVSSAIAALILARRSGIWPGLTALLLRQIRLR